MLIMWDFSDDCGRLKAKNEKLKQIPDGVEITVRTGEKTSSVFISNNTGERKEFAYKGRMLSLKPFEMLIEAT